MQDLPRKLLQSVGIALCCTVLTGLLYLLGQFETFEMRTLDLRFQRAPAASPGVTDPIVIVAVDQKSLQRIDETMDVGWPWPRQFYGEMIRFLAQSAPRAIVFDMLFTEGEIDRMEITGRDSDAALEAATAEAGNVCHAYVLKRGAIPSPRAERDAFMARMNARHITSHAGTALPAFEFAALPSPQLIAASRTLGFVNLFPEEDEVVRRMPIAARYGNMTLPGLSLSIAAAVNVPAETTIAGQDLRSVSTTAPTDAAGRFYIWWYPPPKDEASAFRYYPASDILRAAGFVRRGMPSPIPAESFRNKIVLFGSTASGLVDIKATPIGNLTPGVEIQATALLNLLRGEFVRRSNRPVVLGLVTGVCLLLSLCARASRHVYVGASAAALTVVLTLWGSTRLLTVHKVFLDVVPILFGASLSFLGATFVNYVSERRHSRMIRGIFEHYLDKSVVKTLILNPDKVQLGGEERTCTCLFCDVANFTNTSEKMTPAELVRFMNLYLNEMTEIVLADGGFLDKFVGDMIVAIFGAPNDLPDHAVRSCRTNLAMQKRLRELQSKFADMGCGEIKARTGISTGTMVVGNMGSQERMNYTAMGDVMNLGSRLEGVNKNYGTLVIVSETTRNEAVREFEFRELDFVRVKGKDEPIRIYELVAGHGQLSPEQRSTLDRFAEGLRLYRAKAWTPAERCFADGARAGDPPSSVFLERCREYAQWPPPDDWDGAYAMRTK